MTGMHVGTASVTWGFDPLYDWTVTPSFDRLLDEMAACRYEGTEISYHFPMDVALLRDELARRGLRAASTFHAVDLLDPARRSHPYLFEHHPKRYVWSFCRTALGLLLVSETFRPPAPAG